MKKESEEEEELKQRQQQQTGQAESRDQLDHAAIKIQSTFRGFKTRKELEKIKNPGNDDNKATSDRPA